MNGYGRDERGLLENKKEEYQFNEDGSINWRGMVSEEHLYPNRDWFESRNKEVPNSVAGLEDHQLLIKLAGIRELANLRGFNSLYYRPIETSKERAVVSCEMTFIQNFESPETRFTEIANATLDNTDNFAKKFLESIACNRAFVRCVRAYLNIPIVGADELDKSSKEENEEQASAQISPQNTLKKIANENGYSSFEDLKEFLIDRWKSLGEEEKEKEKPLWKNAKSWKEFSDIPAKQSRILIKTIKG